MKVASLHRVVASVQISHYCQYKLPCCLFLINLLKTAPNTGNPIIPSIFGVLRERYLRELMIHADDVTSWLIANKHSCAAAAKAASNHLYSSFIKKPPWNRPRQWSSWPPECWWDAAVSTSLSCCSARRSPVSNFAFKFCVSEFQNYFAAVPIKCSTRLATKVTVTRSV